jgi:hypothetical protein
MKLHLNNFGDVGYMNLRVWETFHIDDVKNKKRKALSEIHKA